MKRPWDLGVIVWDPWEPWQGLKTQIKMANAVIPGSVGLQNTLASGSKRPNHLRIIWMIVVIISLTLLNHIQCARLSARSFMDIYTVWSNTTTLGGKYHKYPHFIDEEIGAWSHRSEWCWPRSLLPAPGLHHPQNLQFPHLYLENCGTKTASCPASSVDMRRMECSGLWGCCASLVLCLCDQLFLWLWTFQGEDSTIPQLLMRTVNTWASAEHLFLPCSDWGTSDLGLGDGIGVGKMGGWGHVPGEQARQPEPQPHGDPLRAFAGWWPSGVHEAGASFTEVRLFQAHLDWTTEPWLHLNLLFTLASSFHLVIH